MYRDSFRFPREAQGCHPGNPTEFSVGTSEYAVPIRKPTFRATGRPLPSLPPFGGNSPSDRCRRGFARSCRDPTSDVSAAFSQRRGKHGTRVRELPEPLPSPHPPAGKRSSAPRQTHHFHRPYSLRMKSHQSDTRPAFGRIDRSGHRFRTDTTLRKTAFLDFSTEDTPTENRKRFFRRGRHTHRAFSENKTIGGEADRNKTDSLISVSGPSPHPRAKKRDKTGEKQADRVFAGTGPSLSDKRPEVFHHFTPDFVFSPKLALDQGQSSDRIEAPLSQIRGKGARYFDLGESGSIRSPVARNPIRFLGRSHLSYPIRIKRTDRNIFHAPIPLDRPARKGRKK